MQPLLDWFLQFVNSLPLDTATKNFLTAFGWVVIIVIPALGLIVMLAVVRALADRYITGPLYKTRTSRAMLDEKFDELEMLMRDYYEMQGFEVFHVGKSGDRGADVVATKDGRRYVIQCKNWQGRAGPDVVEATFRAKEIQKAHGAILIASGGFTSGALARARALGMELKDGGDVEAMRRAVRKK